MWPKSSPCPNLSLHCDLWLKERHFPLHSYPSHRSWQPSLTPCLPSLLTETYSFSFPGASYLSLLSWSPDHSSAASTTISCLVAATHLLLRPSPIVRTSPHASRGLFKHAHLPGCLLVFLSSFIQLGCHSLWGDPSEPFSGLGSPSPRCPNTGPFPFTATVTCYFGCSLPHQTPPFSGKCGGFLAHQHFVNNFIPFEQKFLWRVILQGSGDPLAGESGGLSWSCVGEKPTVGGPQPAWAPPSPAFPLLHFPSSPSWLLWPQMAKGNTIYTSLFGLESAVTDRNKFSLSSPHPQVSSPLVCESLKAALWKRLTGRCWRQGASWRVFWLGGEC